MIVLSVMIAAERAFHGSILGDLDLADHLGSAIGRLRNSSRYSSQD